MGPEAGTLTRPPEPAVHRRRWAGFAVILVAEVMDLLDSTAVTVALPAIQDGIGGSRAQLQWISAGYTLAFAVTLITGARLGDVYGRRRMFQLGGAAFLAASLLCALAGDPGVLVAGRLLQGAAAGLMTPQGLGLIRELFPPQEAAKAYGVIGPVLGLTAVCGPVVGGALLGADLFGTGWRAVFLVNLPIGAAALVLGARLLPECRSPRPLRLDPVGAVLVGAVLLLLLYPVIEGGEHGLPAGSLGLLALAVPGLLVLARWLPYKSRRDGSPLVEPGLFANRTFVAALAVGTVFFAAMTGLVFVLTLYLQDGLGQGPLAASVTLLPWTLGTFLGAGLAGGLLGPRYGRHTLHGGLAGMAAGCLGLAFTVEGLGSTSGWAMAPSLAVAGTGMGLVFAPFFDIAVAGVGDHEVGSASGLLHSVQQIGGAFGVGVLGALFFRRAGGAAADFPAGLTAVLLATAALLAATFAVAFLLPRRARPDGAAH